eukprot:5014361-Pleurochrysis_carterae.AAC.1
MSQRVGLLLRTLRRVCVRERFVADGLRLNDNFQRPGSSRIEITALGLISKRRRLHDSNPGSSTTCEDVL